MKKKQTRRKNNSILFNDNKDRNERKPRTNNMENKLWWCHEKKKYSIGNSNLESKCEVNIFHQESNALEDFTAASGLNQCQAHEWNNN